MFHFAGVFDFFVFIVFEFWIAEIPTYPDEHRNTSKMSLDYFWCWCVQSFHSWLLPQFLAFVPNSNVHWIHNDKIAKRFRTSSRKSWIECVCRNGLRNNVPVLISFLSTILLFHVFYLFLRFSPFAWFNFFSARRSVRIWGDGPYRCCNKARIDLR